MVLGFVSVMGQTEITGHVKERSGTPIFGANVYLQGTYDGATTNENGYFAFTTFEEGTVSLIVSYLSFETFSVSGGVEEMQGIEVVMREDVNALETVVISAGMMEAGDNSKVAALKPLDIVTTASAVGDFVGALQTLPGTTTVAEDGRLFVRGGDAGETQIFIDGIRVFTPYTPTTNNIPTRGRYSPFLFDGITFSTGGYSAEYGQALSSVLLLNTIDEPDQNKTDISIMSVGGGLGHTRKWQKSSLSLNSSYINLGPYLAIYPDRNDWEKPFGTLAGEAVYRHEIGDGLFKAYAAYDSSNFRLTQEDIDQPEGVFTGIRNSNFYGNSSYSGRLSDTWQIETGASLTLAGNKFEIDSIRVDNTERSAHLKLKLRKRFSNRIKLHVGVEQFLTDFDESFRTQSIDTEYGFNNHISAAFAETDLIFSRKFATKLGARLEYSALFDEFTFSPRLSVAYKTGKNSQFSLAYGDFYQQPGSEILKFSNGLSASRSSHYIANYQYVANGRILRVEGFYKDYDNLVRYSTPMPGFGSDFSDNGNGYAAGVDLFWRDNKSIKNLDYWLSYSYLDSKRLFQDYPIKATPPFVNSHNLSAVAKWWISDLKSQVGFSYQFGSGRTYTNPNRPGFLQEQTKAFNSLSLNWAYLISQQKILYISVNNVLGYKNINGYQYASAPDASGNFDRRALRPAADQFFFVGFFWTLSDDGTDNQLDNL